MPRLTEQANSAREVPAYEVHEFRPRKTRYAVLIPALNEADRLLSQLRRMAFLADTCDIILGDGGSTDTSGDPDVISGFAVRTLLIKRGPGKLSAQLRMLLDYGLNQGYDGFVLIDGNGKDGVEAIPSFLAALDRGDDYIQGSRYIKGGVELNTPWDRKLGVALFHAPVISLAAGFRYTDTTNGFRALSRRVLLDPGVRPFRDIFDTYNLHYYLSVRIPRLGYRVTELPVRREYPAHGPIPSKIGGFQSKLKIVRLVILAALGRYNPPKGPADLKGSADDR